MKNSLFILVSFFVLNAQAQCCFTDTYSTSVGWTMNGSSYTIGPNSFNFNATPCLTYNYATRQLPCTLSDSKWVGDIDFEYTGRGSGGVAHTLLSLTAGTLDSWNTGGTSYASSNQNAIEAFINSPYAGAQSTDSIFGRSKNGSTWNTASKGIPLSMNVQYYLRLERISSTVGRISLFTNAARTIHAPGSPQTFAIVSTVSGLNVVQHGCIPQGNSTRTLTGALENLNICDSIRLPVSTCCYTDTYTTSVGWTMNGSNYTIGPNSFNFNATPCLTYNYATRQLPCTLSDSTWAGDVDYEYTGRGSGGVAHTLLSLTAGTLDSWNTGGTSYASSNQNAIEAFINSPYAGAQSTDSIFGRSKNGSTWNTASKGIPLSMNVQYYLRLERVSSTVGRISLFTNAARTIHAPGSPQTFAIVSTVSGLNVVQHGCIPQGNSTRTLTGTLNNLNICDNVAHTTGIIETKKNNALVDIYPNPNNGTFIIEPNTTEKQTILIYDISGKIVLSQILNGKATIDASNLSEGVYNVSISSNEGVINKRIVITK